MDRRSGLSQMNSGYIKMDASRFYALLRFEEAALALRAVMRMNLVDELGDKQFTPAELQEKVGFTHQAARTFFALLHVMDILEFSDGKYRVTKLAATCLADGVATSRKPYLAMGSGEEVDLLIRLLKGDTATDALPLYGSEDAGETLMDIPEAGQEIAIGLSSRARNFAAALAKAVAEHAGDANTIADIGAGSPYVAMACLAAMPSLEKFALVDRANGMQFARQIIQEQSLDDSRIGFHEADFFAAVPGADVYVVSNTAHDWRPKEYSTILQNIRAVMPDEGLVCIHEPLLLSHWNDEAEWIEALWMACYALTLFRLTLGEGTCYTIAEHNEILSENGFAPTGNPVKTCDGCTALFYRLEG